MRIVIFALGMGLAACSRQATTPPEPTPPPAAATPAPTPADAAPRTDDAALVTPGAEPRVALRYRVPDGTRRTVSWKMQVGGAKPASMALTWSYEIGRQGDAQGDTMTVAMRVLDGGEQLAGVEGRWALSDRGRHAVPTAKVDARSILQQTQAEHMLPILPSQPVGVGATWSVPTSISAGIGVGAMPGQTAWELRSLEGSIATVRGTLEAPEAKIPFRDTVVTMSATGTIEARIDLTQLTGDSTMKLSMTSAGTSLDSSLSMQIR